MHYHVFNGDADGICAMVQLYRSAPVPDAKIITGRKRDITLLDRVNPAQGDTVIALDISMRSNMKDVHRILKSGATLFYVDHHNAGDIPDHDNLIAVIDTQAQMCTAILVDDILNGAYRAWAVTAAFGDNFPKLACEKAQGLDLPLGTLERLGVLINYNGYGASVEDLHFNPAALFEILREFDTPMEFLAERPDIFEALDGGYEADMAGARSAQIVDQSASGLILELEDSPSSRRVSGVYGNALAQENSARAHAILTRAKDGYVVSVRAPLKARTGADTVCMKFETGGGRAAAAGINHLPDAQLSKFIDAFQAQFS